MRAFGVYPDAFYIQRCICVAMDRRTKGIKADKILRRKNLNDDEKMFAI
ncbi:hypothetical protein [Bacteroides acidifaciens]|nr:hypothetical protein [Bacteroides acidifaciens]